jgi:hypothetical protein
MKDKFYYFLIIIWILSFFVYNPFNLINLVVLGIILKLFINKKTKKSYSTWTLIAGIGIVICNLLIRLGYIFGFIKL